MKICVIGNSHLGAFKAGWDKIKNSHLDIECTFFGAPNMGTRERLAFLKLEESRLIPTRKDVADYFCITSGGHKAIDVNVYDRFLVIGCGLGLSPIARCLYAQYTIDSRKENEQPKQLISEACFNEAALGLLQGSLAVKLSNVIRSVSDKPVIIIPTPHPSELVLELNSSNKAWANLITLWRSMFKVGDAKFIGDIFQASLKQLRQQGYKILGADEDIITREILTKKKYSEASAWLQNGKYEKSPSDDYFHMNGQYGATLLKKFIQE